MTSDRQSYRTIEQTRLAHGAKIHMLKRFGQSVTVCPMIPRRRPPIVTNEPGKVTCKLCQRLIGRTAR